MKRILPIVAALALAGCSADDLASTRAVLAGVAAGVQAGTTAAAEECREQDRTKCVVLAQQVGAVGAVGSAAAEQSVTVLDTILNDSVVGTTAKPDASSETPPIPDAETEG